MKRIARNLLGILTATLATLAAVALCILVFYAVKPVKTLVIKVPVPTDKAAYAPGDTVKGLFFGEVYWHGAYVIVRKVICPNYSGYIKDYRDNDNVFQGVSSPHVLNGQSSKIGALPADTPTGSQCVIQFVNSYSLPTPFGARQIDYFYFTQGFTVSAPEAAQATPTPQPLSPAALATTGVLAPPTRPYAADPVTQEPTQPPPTPASPPTESAPQPGVLTDLVNVVKGLVGL